MRGNAIPVSPVPNLHLETPFPPKLRLGAFAPLFPPTPKAAAIFFTQSPDRVRRGGIPLSKPLRASKSMAGKTLPPGPDA